MKTIEVKTYELEGGRSMSKELKRYAERDIMEMDRAGNYYCHHVSAMTGEGLHSKSDIAAELGWRDMQIDALLAERDRLKALLLSSREFVAAYVSNSFFGPNARKQLDDIDAALKGEQK